MNDGLTQTLACSAEHKDPDGSPKCFCWNPAAPGKRCRNLSKFWKKTLAPNWGFESNAHAVVISCAE
jgi:hypothetical protein